MYYLVEGETLTGIADSIRLKTGNSSAIALNQFSNEIDNIKSTNPIEAVTGTIYFDAPYNPYIFCYEDENGVINKFDTALNMSATLSPIDFTIRKNSMIVFQCPSYMDGPAPAGGGLTSDILESANGIEIIQITKADLTTQPIIDAVCKVVDDFNISWYVEELVPGM